MRAVITGGISFTGALIPSRKGIYFTPSFDAVVDPFDSPETKDVTVTTIRGDILSVKTIGHMTESEIISFLSQEGWGPSCIKRIYYENSN